MFALEFHFIKHGNKSILIMLKGGGINVKIPQLLFLKLIK